MAFFKNRNGGGGSIFQHLIEYVVVVKNVDLRDFLVTLREFRKVGIGGNVSEYNNHDQFKIVKKNIRFEMIVVGRCRIFWTSLRCPRGEYFFWIEVEVVVLHIIIVLFLPSTGNWNKFWWNQARNQIIWEFGNQNIRPWNQNSLKNFNFDDEKHLYHDLIFLAGISYLVKSKTILWN